jgi:hypothetical protein
MSQKYLLALLAGVSLALPSIAQTTLETLPQPLRSHVLLDYADALEDVSVKNLSDVNSDGKDDFILTVNSAIYCGSAGCQTEVLISNSRAYAVAYRGNLLGITLQAGREGLSPRFDAIGHLSFCNGKGGGACEFVLELRGAELVRIGEKR